MTQAQPDIEKAILEELRQFPPVKNSIQNPNQYLSSSLNPSLNGNNEALYRVPRNHSNNKAVATVVKNGDNTDLVFTEYGRKVIEESPMQSADDVYAAGFPVSNDFSLDITEPDTTTSTLRRIAHRGMSIAAAFLLATYASTAMAPKPPTPDTSPPTEIYTTQKEPCKIEVTVEKGDNLYALAKEHFPDNPDASWLKTVKIFEEETGRNADIIHPAETVTLYNDECSTNKRSNTQRPSNESRSDIGMTINQDTTQQDSLEEKIGSPNPASSSNISRRDSLKAHVKKQYLQQVSNYEALRGAPKDSVDRRANNLPRAVEIYLENTPQERVEAVSRELNVAERTAEQYIQDIERYITDTNAEDTITTSNSLTETYRRVGTIESKFDTQRLIEKQVEYLNQQIDEAVQRGRPLSRQDAITIAMAAEGGILSDKADVLVKVVEVYREKNCLAMPLTYRNK